MAERWIEHKWDTDCMHWRGRVLTGRYAHWCYDWDGLPIDETTSEWPCGCGIEDDINGQSAGNGENR